METSVDPKRSHEPHEQDAAATRPKKGPKKVAEYGGPAGLEPTRYGDWERNGRCIDF